MIIKGDKESIKKYLIKSKKEIDIIDCKLGVSLNGVNCNIVIKSVNENVITAELQDQVFNVLNQLSKN